MNSHKHLFDKENGKKSSGPIFEPGTFGSYWWVSTKILFGISVVVGLGNYGHQGVGAIFGVIAVSAIFSPLKALIWASIYWIISRVFR